KRAGPLLARYASSRRFASVVATSTPPSLRIRSLADRSPSRRARRTEVSRAFIVPSARCSGELEGVLVPCGLPNPGHRRFLRASPLVEEPAQYRGETLTGALFLQ